MNGLEQRVEKWVETRLGAKNATPLARILKKFEEDCELVQACGISAVQAIAIVAQVFGNDPGDVIREAEDCAFTTLGWCSAHGLKFEQLAESALARNEARPVEDVQGSLARKGAANLVNLQSMPIIACRHGNRFMCFECSMESR